MVWTTTMVLRMGMELAEAKMGQQILSFSSYLPTSKSGAKLVEEP